VISKTSMQIIEVTWCCLISSQLENFLIWADAVKKVPIITPTTA